MMFNKIGGLLALVGLCGLSVFLVSCGTSSSRPTGLLYVLSQEQSNVSSFAVDLGSGRLSQIRANADTCASGASCGLPLQISLDSKATTAFVLNQGSISGYTVGSDGSLSAPVAGPTFGAGEIAVAMTRDTAAGLLFLVTDLPAIYVFTVTDGSTTLTPLSPFPLNRIPTSVSALTYTPQGGSAQTVLFVTSDLDLSGNHADNQLSVYLVDSSGNLTETQKSPYTLNVVEPTVVQAVNTSAAQQPTIFVYVGNQPPSGSGGVSGFVLCTAAGQSGCSQQNAADSDLLPLGSTVSVGQRPVAMLVDPTNGFLYVGCHDTGQVFAFSIGNNTGKLTPLSPSNVQTGAPTALAMHPGSSSKNEFLYVSNNSGSLSTISGIPVVPTTGVMGSVTTTTFQPGKPSGMAGR